MTMAPKPSVMPKIRGSAPRKPKLAAEAVTSTTLGPGVRHMAAANRTSGPSRIPSPIATLRRPSITRGRLGDRGPRRNYQGGNEPCDAHLALPRSGSCDA